MLSDNTDTGIFSKANDLRNRILFTIFILSVYRLGTYVPLPGIDPESLKKAILICSNLINIIENNYVPFYTDNIPPYLSKRNLYFDRSKDANNHDKFNNQLLFNIDGRNNIVDLCKLTGLTFSNIVEYLGLFYQNGILGKRKVSWIDDEI